MDFLDEVVDLVERHTHFQRRVDQPRGTNQLFDDDPFAFGQLPVGRGGADVDGRALQLLEFVECQRPVVLGRREPEAIFDQVLLARAVTAEHGVYLRNGDVAFVDDHQIILRKIVQQAERPGPRGAPVEVARIVLDAGAVAQFLNHFDVVLDPLFDALRLHRAPLVLEDLDLLAEVEVNLLHGRGDALLGGDEQAGGVERQRIERVDALAGYGVDGVDGLHLVVEEHDPETLVAELAAMMSTVSPLTRNVAGSSPRSVRV